MARHGWQWHRLQHTLAACSLALLAGTAGAEDVSVVAKIGGIPWFNAMEAGIKKAGRELGIESGMVGPTEADAAQQVRAVEDLIARRSKIIAVVPNDAQALEPVFRRARSAGIKVLTHESPGQKGADWNIELSTVQGFGERHMESLARSMGGEGRYAVFVGSLTVPLHNAWADAAIAHQKKHWPRMQQVSERFGVAESLDESYRTAQDLMRAHPDIKGFLAFGSQGPIGAGRAVADARKADRIAVVGSFSPGQGAKLVRDGVIREGFIWNPALAGEVIVHVGKMLIDGREPVDGMELPGLGKVQVDRERRNIQGQKLEAINRQTIDRLVALGL